MHAGPTRDAAFLPSRPIGGKSHATGDHRLTAEDGRYALGQMSVKMGFTRRWKRRGHLSDITAQSEGDLVVTHSSSLTLNNTERVAITRELRRYGNYRRGEGEGLLDAHLLPESGDDESSPGLTDWAKDAAASHVALADRCEELADELDSREVVPVSASHFELIDMSLRAAYPDEMPAELSHVSEFADLVVADTRDGDPRSAESERMLFLVREGNPLPPSPLIPAPARAPSTEDESVEGRIAQLTEQVGNLEARLETQQHQIDALRSRTTRDIRNQRADPLGSGPPRRVGIERGGLSL